MVDHESDGAQQHERLVAHVACPPGEELSIARQLQESVLTNGRQGGFITFMDSRKGVETLAMATEQDIKGLFNDPAVSPYRAGYVSTERREIERKLPFRDVAGCSFHVGIGTRYRLPLVGLLGSILVFRPRGRPIVSALDVLVEVDLEPSS